MRSIRPVLLGFAFLLAGASVSAALSIAAARALPLGTVVTVEGGVTTYSGSYATSTFDQGFALQDHTGGIYVSTAGNKVLSVGNRARVTGALADDGFGQLVIKPASLADVDRLLGIRLFAPDRQDTGDIGEATEGKLVEVEGEVTRILNDIPYGYKVYIDDGSGEVQIFISAATGLNPYRLPFVKVGDEIEVVGLSSQFLAEYEVMPRFITDIRPEH
jgi:DNA/RNA endonuclease YhcR with UshA esterase domain